MCPCACLLGRRHRPAGLRRHRSVRQPERSEGPLRQPKRALATLGAGVAPQDVTGSMTTAVPYATISLIVSPISDESNRIMITALAPLAVALVTMRSMA